MIRKPNSILHEDLISSELWVKVTRYTDETHTRRLEMQCDRALAPRGAPHSDTAARLQTPHADTPTLSPEGRAPPTPTAGKCWLLCRDHAGQKGELNLVSHQYPVNSGPLTGRPGKACPGPGRLSTHGRRMPRSPCYHESQDEHPGDCRAAPHSGFVT